MKKGMTLLFIGLFALAAMNTFHTLVNNPLSYKKYIAEGKKLDEKEIYEDAIEKYQQALTLNPDNEEIQIAIARDYLNLEEETDFEQYCITNLESVNPSDQILKMLMDYYEEQEDDSSAIQILKKTIEKNNDFKLAKEYYRKKKGSFVVLSKAYNSIGNFQNGYAVVCINDVYGLIDNTGSEIIEPSYDSMTVFSADNGFSCVKKDGEFFYINEKNHKKLVPDKAYDELRVFQDGFAVEKDSKGSGFVDETLTVQIGGKWEDCTNFLEDTAAVQKSGKWAFIDTKGKKVTEFEFEDVIQDEYGFCSSEGLIFAKKNDTYQLYQVNGTKVGKKKFEDAKTFQSEGSAAVKIDGKWGFVNADGKIVIEPQYEDARSFSFGLAAVKVDGKWGYIDDDNNQVIEPQFNEAKDFNVKGIAPVCFDEWTLIQLVEYQNS